MPRRSESAPSQRRFDLRHPKPRPPGIFAEINVAEGEPPPRTIVDCGLFPSRRELTGNSAGLRAFRGNSVSLVGVFFQKPSLPRADSRMNRRIDLPRRDRLLVDNLVDHRGDVFGPGMAFSPVTNLIEHDAQRKDVARGHLPHGPSLVPETCSWECHHMGGLLDGAELQNLWRCRKSVTLTVSSAVSIRFAGLHVRWMTLRSCANCNALARSDP